MVWNFLNPEVNLYYCLDIGTESVKALIFNIEKNNEKALILGWGISYFDKFDILGSGDFNRKIMEKSIIQAISNAKINSCLSTAKRELKSAVVSQKKWKTLIGLPPTILKARVENVLYHRTAKEKKIKVKEEAKIYESVSKDAKKKIEDFYCKETGILGRDIYWNSFKIIDFKIDGYGVEKIANYEGCDLEFKALITFLPKQYQNRILEIISGLNITVLKFGHSSEGITELLKEKKGDGFYIDIGGEATQVIGVSNGKIEKISEFEKGVSIFAENISLLFGLDKFSAYMMIEDYCDKKLEKGAMERVKEVFAPDKLRWYEEFKNDLRRTKSGNIFPVIFRFFGGGACLPEFTSILIEKGGKDLDKIFDLDYLDIRNFSMKKLDIFENTTRDLKDLQFMPSLLMCYNFIKEQKINKG